MESEQRDVLTGEVKHTTVNQKFKEIIDRIELVRTHFRLSKSAFGRRIGVKAQTYNNFTGSQGTKPNVELLYGVVTQFGVNPMWLLSGTGEMFMEDRGSGIDAVGPNTVPLPNWAPAANPSERMKELRSKLSPVLERVEAALQRHNGNFSILDRLVDVLRRYARVSPKGFEAEMLFLVEELEQKMKTSVN